MWFAKEHPLPTGMTEFDAWSDRIVNQITFPVSKESLKFVLADHITRLAENVSHKKDAYFISVLHKFASNQIALAKTAEIKAAQRARKMAEDEAKKAALAEEKSRLDAVSREAMRAALVSQLEQDSKDMAAAKEQNLARK